MKKICFIFLTIILSIVLVGCGKKEEAVDLADDEVILENIMYKLDQDDTGYGISYKAAYNFRKSVMINAINYFSENIDDSPYFVIRIYSYPKKDIEYAIKDSVESYEKREEVKVGDLTYTKVYFTNFNGAHTHLYYYKSKNTVYTFVFTSHIDISRLEEIFLTNITY